MENAGKTLQKIKAKRDKQGVSEDVQDLINDRWKAVQELDIDKAKELSQQRNPNRRGVWNPKRQNKVVTF